VQTPGLGAGHFSVTFAFVDVSHMCWFQFIIHQSDCFLMSNSPLLISSSGALQSLASTHRADRGLPGAVCEVEARLGGSGVRIPFHLFCIDDAHAS